MDSVTHVLTGAAITHGWFRRHDLNMRGVVAVGIGASLFPDIDILLLWFGYEPYLQHHRGLTHSLLLMPVWAALLALIPWLMSGRRVYQFWWLLCMVTVTVHILLDVVTSYGTMIWLPINSQRVGWSIMFILDPFVWALLGLALWSALRMRRYDWTRGWIYVFCGYIAFCAVSRQFAILNAGRVSPHERIAAYPKPLNPFSWIIIRSDDPQRVTWENGNHTELFTSHHDNELVPRAEKTRALSLFLWFAEFPVVERFKRGDMTVLRYRDLRFRTVMPWGAPREGLFVVAEVTFDPSGYLVDAVIKRGE